MLIHVITDDLGSLPETAFVPVKVRRVPWETEVSVLVEAKEGVTLQRCEVKPSLKRIVKDSVVLGYLSLCAEGHRFHGQDRVPCAPAGAEYPSEVLFQDMNMELMQGNESCGMVPIAAWG
jgi:hypothetical protein